MAVSWSEGILVGHDLLVGGGVLVGDDLLVGDGLLVGVCFLPGHGLLLGDGLLVGEGLLVGDGLLVNLLLKVREGQIAGLCLEGKDQTGPNRARNGYLHTLSSTMMTSTRTNFKRQAAYMCQAQLFIVSPPKKLNKNTPNKRQWQ